jgi:hypothetical protein
MMTLFFLIAIAAILGAIVAASRTYTKLKLQPNSVQEAIAPEVPKLQPDLDSETATLPMISQPKTDISLATTLKISEAIEPSIEPTLETDSSPEAAHHPQGVLAEIEQLEQTEDTLNHLAGRAIDADPFMRLAVAVELGELAKRGQAVDRVVALLNGLMEDTDLEVRVQAGASLAMLPNALT